MLQWLFNLLRRDNFHLQWNVQTFAEKTTNKQWRTRPLQTGVQIASLACQCCVLVYHIVVSLLVRPHRFTRHDIIEEKTFSVIKGKVWLPQAKFFPWCDISQNGDRIKQNAGHHRPTANFKSVAYVQKQCWSKYKTDFLWDGRSEVMKQLRRPYLQFAYFGCILWTCLSNK